MYGIICDIMVDDVMGYATMRSQWDNQPGWTCRTISNALPFFVPGWVCTTEGRHHHAYSYASRIIGYRNVRQHQSMDRRWM